MRRSTGLAVFVLCTAVAVAWVAAPTRAIDFEKFKNCKDCLAAGFGWCPNMRRCGGFANNRCRGDVTDTRRSPAEEKEFMERIERAEAQRGGGRNAPPPPPPPRQAQQQQHQAPQNQRGAGGGGGGGGDNPLAPGKLVDFSFGIEKHLTGHHLKTQLIVFTAGVDSDETKALKKAAKKLRSRALVVRIVAKDFKQVFERFGFKGNRVRLPQLAIADFTRNAGLEVYRNTEPYHMRRAVDLSGGSRAGAAKIIAFMESYDKGELPLYVRSQPMPSTDPFRFPPYPTGQVLTAVGDNLPAILYDKRQPVLLFAWMPGCAHCKAFTETFAALAPAFAMRVAFVSMDGTQNDVDHPKVTFGAGYPSIWFFGRSDAGKQSPVQHTDRDRSKKGFTAWLNEQLRKDEALLKAQKLAAKAGRKAAAAADDDDTVFADDDDEEDDDDDEYRRPTPNAPPAPPAAPAKPKEQPKELPKATPPKPAAAAAEPKAKKEKPKADDVLWGPNDEWIE